MGEQAGSTKGGKTSLGPRGKLEQERWNDWASLSRDSPAMLATLLPDPLMLSLRPRSWGPPRPVEPIRPAPAGPDEPRTRFHHDTRAPRAVLWFGVRGLWGHLRHFLASSIATEDIDSRDWMHPDEFDHLLTRIGVELGVLHPGGQRVRKPLTELLHRDLWIDFIADTGDSAEVSEAVARLLFREYELPDLASPGQHVIAPRGEILLFGGDIAYPVGTVVQIQDRLVAPFNRVLEQVDDGKPRILMGIPGNHDWYDGLDGFARMFRRKLGVVEAEQLEELLPTTDSSGVKRLRRVVDFVEKFVTRKTVTKRKALVLAGYVAVQHASYFVLPLTERLHLWGVDRQLRSVDFRQRRFFAAWREQFPEASPFLVMHDPPRAFLRPNPIAEETLRGLPLDLHARRHLVMTGDMHHYVRWHEGETTHVTAGGGGAFLHPAPVARQGLPVPDREWPGPRASLALLRQVILRATLGQAGLWPHVMVSSLLLLVVAVAHLRWEFSLLALLGVSLVGGVLVSIGYGIFAVSRYANLRAGWLLSIAHGFATTTLAAVGTALSTELLCRRGHVISSELSWGLFIALGGFLGGFFFGLLLYLTTRLGIECTQAFTALGHPGYKHFVRLRVRVDGSGVDVWVLGLIDPLAPDAEPVLVDSFIWRPD